MILERLRSETQQDHQEVELAVDLPGRLRCASKYSELLAQFFRLHFAFEAEFVQTQELHDLGLNLAERRRAHLIRHDLVALGWTAEEVAALGGVNEVPKVDISARLLGCLYVLEGSTLGGRVICHEAVKAGLAPETLTFFAGYGKQTSTMWNGFGKAVSSYATTNPQDADEIVCSAKATFRVFQQGLTVSPQLPETVIREGCRRSAV